MLAVMEEYPRFLPSRSHRHLFTILLKNIPGNCWKIKQQRPGRALGSRYSFTWVENDKNMFGKAEAMALHLLQNGT